jgi:ATP-binding cassette subfamily B protein
MEGSPALQLVAGPLRRDAQTAPPPEPLRTLAVRGLTCLHPASERGVCAIDLSLSRGDFVVITGRVGAGKTTLLRALLGLVPSDGEIVWNGAIVADPASFMVPPRCAYTAQAPRLFSETIGDNVRMGENASAEALADAVRLAVFEQDLAGFEAGLDTLVGTRGVTLSGGQLQRAAAARMFVRQTDLLVFDDISSALDTPTEQALWRGLFATGDRTCLAVSHRRQAFLRADKIILLDEGRIVACGDAASLRQGSDLFREIWRHDD